MPKYSQKDAVPDNTIVYLLHGKDRGGSMQINSTLSEHGQWLLKVTTATQHSQILSYYVRGGYIHNPSLWCYWCHFSSHPKIHRAENPWSALCHDSTLFEMG